MIKSQFNSIRVSDEDATVHVAIEDDVLTIQFEHPNPMITITLDELDLLNHAANCLHTQLR